MRRALIAMIVAVAFVVMGGLVPLRQAPSGGSSPLVATGLALIASPEAIAQRKRKRSLMNMLFGRRDARRRAVKRRRSVKRQRARKRRTVKKRARVKRRTAKTRAKPQRSRTAKRKRTRTRRAVVRAAPAAGAATAAVASTRQSDEETSSAPVTTAEPKTVLVVGDFYAGGLAFGLERALDAESGISVDKRTVASSGLVRDDVVDWPKRIAELVAERKPDYIVFQLGSNDRQLMRTEKGAFKPREAGWDAEYKERIAAVAAALKAAGTPFLWVGVPPVRFKSMNRDFLVFNEWYAEAAKAAGGKFVDVWDGFSDEDGNYTRSGPDVSGRIVVLRGKDGINMTTRGKDKLGWYATATVEKALAGPRVFTSLPPIDLGSPEIAKQVYNPARTGRTLVVNLDDPKVDGTAGLAGAGDLEPSAPVAVKSVPSGRADDFTWPAGR